MSDLVRRFPPRRDPPGRLKLPEPRAPKERKPLKKRNEKRAAARFAECFAEQAAECRRRACSVPGCRRWPVIPHHALSRGAGGVDRHCAPLCHDHHAQAHDGHDLGVDLLAVAEALHLELERKKGHDCEAQAELREHEPTLSSRYVCRVCGYVLPDEQEGEDE